MRSLFPALLALLLLQSGLFFVSVQSDRSVSRHYGPSLFFLQDLTDGQCLAGERFERCGVNTLWHVTGKPGSYQLHKYTDGSEEEHDEDDFFSFTDAPDRCLQRTQCEATATESPLALGDCGRGGALCGARRWNILGDASSGFVLTEDRNKLCVQRLPAPLSHTRDDDGVTDHTTLPYNLPMDTARLGDCDKVYVQFALQFVSRDDLVAMRAPAARLIHAALRRDLKEIEDLLAKFGEKSSSSSSAAPPLSVDTQDWDNTTAVLAAASQGHYALLKTLVETHRAAVDVPDKDGMTALLEAARTGREEIVALLHAHQADVHHTAYSGVSALWLAAAGGHKNIAKRLLSLGADANSARSDGVTVLMAAAGGNHSEVVDLLIENNKGKEDTETSLLIDVTDNSGSSAFIHAAESGCVQCIHTLSAQPGVDRERLTQTGYTALIIAAAQGHSAVLRELLADYPEQGVFAVNVHAENPDNVTALMYAAASGDLESVKLLIDAGVNVNALHSLGGSALGEAAAAGHTEVLKVLIENKADVQVADKDGVTPLISAASAGHTDACAALLSHGAAVDAATQQGSTALHVAVHGGHDALLSLLLSHNADVNAQTLASAEYIERVAERESERDKKDKDKESEREGEEDEPHVDGVTPLMLASQRGHTTAVSLLLSLGADATLVDDEDASAVQYALRPLSPSVSQSTATALQDERQREILTMLIAHNASIQVPLKDAHGAPVNLLLESVSHNHTALALTLLSHGADVAVADEQGVTPLIQAAFLGQREVVEALLARDADVCARNGEGVNALIAAASEGHEDVVRLLLDHRRTVDSSTAAAAAVEGEKETKTKSQEEMEKDKQPPLRGSPSPCAAAQVDGGDTDGTTALMAAAVRAHTGVLSLLLDRNAAVDAQNADGHTALMFAFNGKHQVQQLLEKYRGFLVADSEKEKESESDKASEKETLALIQDALAQHARAVELLISRGASMTVRDKEGHVAADFDFLSIAEDERERDAEKEKEKKLKDKEL